VIDVVSDANVALKWFHEHGEEDVEPARELLARHRAREVMVHVLDLTFYEVANGVVRRWGDAAAAAKLCRSVELRCKGNVVGADPSLLEATAEIAVKHGLTTYDAAYVAAARRFDWRLVSTDVRDLVSKGLAITPDAAV